MRISEPTRWQKNHSFSLDDPDKSSHYLVSFLSHFLHMSSVTMSLCTIAAYLLKSVHGHKMALPVPCRSHTEIQVMIQKFQGRKSYWSSLRQLFALISNFNQKQWSKVARPTAQSAGTVGLESLGMSMDKADRLNGLSLYCSCSMKQNVVSSSLGIKQFSVSPEGMSEGRNPGLFL